MKRKKLYEKANRQFLRAYQKQKNYISRFYKKERKMFFVSSNTLIVSDNRKFWQTIKKCIILDKANYGSNTTLVENEKIIGNNIDIAEELNNCFKFSGLLKYLEETVSSARY